MVLTTAIAIAATGDLDAGLMVVAENPHIGLVQGGASSAQVTLRLANTSSIDVSPMVFYATVQIVKGDSALGDVLISSVTAASDYVFKDTTVHGLQKLPVEPESPAFPTLRGTWFDAAETSEAGVAIAGGQSAGLMEVELVVSADAQGDFYVVLGPFDEEFDKASSWSDGADPGTPLEFANANAGSTTSQRTLARIDVVAVPEPTATIPALFSLAALIRRRR